MTSDEPSHDDEPDGLDTRLNDLEARMDALNRSRLHLRDRIEELEAENDQLRDDLATLNTVVDPDPGRTEYDQLARSHKVNRIRTTLAETAARSNGKDAMKYKEVMMLFDGHPSPGHCYDLMERAAHLDGFAYDDGRDGEKRIRVNLPDVNDETLIHAANKATTLGGV